MTMLQLLETVSKCLILFKIKEDENFNHRKPFSISRIKIWAWRRYWAKWDVLKLSYLIITIQRQLVKIFVSRNTGLKKVEEELKTLKKGLRLWLKIEQTFTRFRQLIRLMRMSTSQGNTRLRGWRLKRSFRSDCWKAFVISGGYGMSRHVGMAPSEVEGNSGEGRLHPPTTAWNHQAGKPVIEEKTTSTFPPANFNYDQYLSTH